MARKDMVATGKAPLRYQTRMLAAGEPLTVDGPRARLYGALGWAETAGGKPAKAKTDTIADLRAEYEKKLGKRPFNGWDAATLRAKIDAV